MVTAAGEQKKRKRGRPKKKKQSQNALDNAAKTWFAAKFKAFFEEAHSKVNQRGNNPLQIQKMQDMVSAIMCHSGPVPGGLKSAIRRVTGVTKSMLDRGDKLREEGKTCTDSLRKNVECHVKRSPHSFGKRKKRDLMFVYEWFHHECPLVYPNKTRPQAYKGRLARIKINGQTLKVTCVPAYRDGTKADLVQSFLSSPRYKAWQIENNGDSLPSSSIQRCICPCMQPAQVNECACKMCTEFSAVLTAWDKAREKWHGKTTCTCVGCSDAAAFKLFRGASASVTDFRKAVCCPKKTYPHLALPSSPDVVPTFYNLKCCKASQNIPKHIDRCRECGIEAALYRHDDCVEQTDDKVSWMQWVETEVDSNNDAGGKAVRKVYKEVVGTRKKLHDRIRELAPPFLFHLWCHQMTTQQSKLREETFDGDTTILVKADFAATVTLKSEHMATCEYGRTTNLYVALVLHSPEQGPLKPGEKRKAQCDVWRYFTNAKASAMVHQRVLQDIAKHYKKLIPTLKYMETEADGCASQFKGRYNFRVIAGGHFGLDMYDGVKQSQRNLTTGHGGGVVDNQGKVAKDALNKRENVKKGLATYYDSYKALNGSMLRSRKEVPGTWACNGKLFFGALSDGKDAGGRKHNVPVVPTNTTEVTGVPGCQLMYAFKHAEVSH